MKPAAKVISQENVFRINWIYWRILGHDPTKNNRILYYTYSAILNILVTILYPLHLLIVLFQTATPYDIFKNLALCLTALICSIKTIIIWSKLRQMRKINAIMLRLNERIVDEDEVRYYNEVTLYEAKRNFYIISAAGWSAVLTSAASVLLSVIFLHKWHVMFPAYFPFDPLATNWNFALAFIYQLFGEGVLISQNLNNDTIGGTGLTMLAGYARILGMRVAKIGYKPGKTRAQNNAELIQCIQDHRNLLEYHQVIMDIVSISTLLQIICSTLNMGVIIIYIMFFVDNIFGTIYYTFYMFCMPMQIFPCCYYSTVFEIEMEHLPYYLFSCNWTNQDRKFKRNLGIFVEQSLKKRTSLAGGLVRIHLDTFFGTLKMAYSLFTLVMQMK